VAPWAAYHSSEHFTAPFEFHPERFLKDGRFAVIVLMLSSHSVSVLPVVLVASKPTLTWLPFLHFTDLIIQALLSLRLA
jgi:cytochrome P450